MEPEFTITVDNPGKRPPPGVQDQQTPGRAAASRPTPEQIAAKRQKLHEITHAANAAAGAEKPEPDQTPPREDVESVWVRLRDGRAVLLGPPAGISLNLRMAQILGVEHQGNQVLATQLRTLMCIRNIAPVGYDVDDATKNAYPPPPLPPLGNMVDAQKIANMVGDDGMDLCTVALNAYWPPVLLSELRVVKKNLR